jgi:hypothetical protein
LQFEPAVDPADIGITAKDGIVTLTGKAKSLAEKCSAVRAAERVTGVRAVVDEVKVEVPSLYKRTDEEIARTVLNALKWDVFVPEGTDQDPRRKWVDHPQGDRRLQVPTHCR